MNPPLVDTAGGEHLPQTAWQHRIEPADHPPSIDLAGAEAAVKDLLAALGENPDREGLQDTPARVTRAMVEILAGRNQHAEAHLSRTFVHAAEDVVMLKEIEFFSLCEHHLLPFIGTISIAYQPGTGRVVGLSKLARVVDTYARRLQLQERLTQQVADALVEHLTPLGVAVLGRAEHLCMKMRGVSKRVASMETLALRGRYREDAAMRAEVIALLKTA